MEFNKLFIASLKRTAQNVYPLVRRRNKIKEQIEDLSRELEELQVEIDGYQFPIVKKTGFTTDDLIKRTVIDTGKKDKNGQPIKITQYTLIYPDTVVPPKEEEQQTQEEQVVEDIPVDTAPEEINFTEESVKSEETDDIFNF